MLFRSIDRAKSAENPRTFSLTASPLPTSLPSASLPSASLLLPPNTSKKRLNKAYLAFILRKRAKKAANINLKLKIAIKSYILVILF